MTAREWRKLNLDLIGNICNYANVTELVCLVNLENLNSVYINEKLEQSKRLSRLNEIAIHQMMLLDVRIKILDRAVSLKLTEGEKNIKIHFNIYT